MCFLREQVRQTVYMDCETGLRHSEKISEKYHDDFVSYALRFAGGNDGFHKVKKMESSAENIKILNFWKSSLDKRS